MKFKPFRPVVNCRSTDNAFLFVADLLDGLHFLDLFELQWTELRPGLVLGPLPSPRIYSELAGGVGWGSKIYVIGGNVPADGTSFDGAPIKGCEKIACITRCNSAEVTSAPPFFCSRGMLRGHIIRAQEHTN